MTLLKTLSDFAYFLKLIANLLDIVQDYFLLLIKLLLFFHDDLFCL